MPEFSTFSARGVEQQHARGGAHLDLRASWPTRDTLLGGQPGPVWDVDAPLDRPLTAVVHAPAGELALEVTTLRLHIGVDEVLSVVGATRSFTDHEETVEHLLRSARIAGLHHGRVDAVAERLAAGDPGRRDRHTVNGGSALGVRVGVTVHRLPVRGEVPAVDVLEWSVTPASDGPDGIIEDDGWVRW